MKKTSSLLALVICMMLLLVYLPTFVSGDVDTTIGEGYYSPQRALARASDGTLYTVYSSLDETVIMCSISTDNGSTWSESSLASGYSVRQPTIAVDSNDIVYVFWEDFDGDVTSNIKYCFYNGSWSEVYYFVDMGYDSEISIAVNSTNCVHAVWLHGDNMIYKGFFDYYTETIATTDTLVIGNVANPTIVIDEWNNIHVAWEVWNSFGESTTGQIQYRFWNGTWEAPYNVTEANENESCELVSLVADGSSVHFAWTNSNFSIGTYQYRNFDFFALEWSEITDIYSWTLDTGQPHCSLSRDSVYIYAVFDGEIEGDLCLYYSIFDGEWGAPIFIRNVTDYGTPNLIFAQYPIISGTATNIPETGFAFVYYNNSVTSFVTYYSNVTWQQQEFSYKMHFPQLPDPTGWDVVMHSLWGEGDDWLCTETGNVSEIHFWMSWRDDMIDEIPTIYASIWSNNVGESFSYPDTKLWDREFINTEFSISGPWVGDQGWYNPWYEYTPHDHMLYYRVDIMNITNPFYQEQGNLYWLVLGMKNNSGLHEPGWKTSQDHFMDNAVRIQLTEYPNPVPLHDPLTQEQIDLAFIIGPTDYVQTYTAPIVVTNNATGIGMNNATLQGTLTENGGALCTVWFEWGTNTSYGYVTDNQSKAGGDFSTDISPLDSGVTYHYRAVAQNIKGTSYGDDKSFTTLTFGDNTTFPNAKMTNPQYPDPLGWDVDFTAYGGAMIADDWQCSQTGNVTDIHLWVSSYYDICTKEEIENAFGKDLVPNSYLLMAIFSNVDDQPSHPGSVLWLFDGMSGMTCDISVVGPFGGDEGWLSPNDFYEAHNHQLFWRVDITNISDPFTQVNGTIYWLMVQPIPPQSAPVGWKTSQDHFMDNAVFTYDIQTWYPISDVEPYIDPIDLAFIITGELAPLPPSFDTTYYVNTSFNSGTPGWHTTHWDNIQEAVENCTNALYNFTVLVDGDGNIYNENVLVGTAESYNTLSMVGNYTTTRPRVNGQGVSKSTFELVNDKILVSGFTIYNNIGKPNSFHGISIGKTLILLQDQNNITITDCYITQASSGVLLRGKYFNISNNEIDSTTLGIDVIGPAYDNAFSTYYGNYIHGCQVGISLYFSSNNTIARNNISSSTLYGIELQVASNYNTIYYNDVSNSGTYGIRISALGDFGCRNNLIYNNNFINNNPYVQGTKENFWNMSYPTCGNYYSLLAGNDNYRGPNQDIPGSDGIRDTQYTIATNNTDYYPFLHAFDGTYPSLGYSYITSEQPANNSEYVLVEADMSVMVGDENLENVDVYFFWANGTLINSVNDVPSNSVASFKILDYYTMSHGTTYSWYVTFVNSTGGMTSPIWTFTTCRSYDLNGDGVINYLDVSALVSHYGDTIPQDVQETMLRPIGDGLATWTQSPPAPANFFDVMEIIPDDPMTFVWANPPVGSPELYLIGTPSYTYSIINVTLNARMCSVAGGDFFQHCIWDGIGAPSFGPPMPTVTLFPFFQTYSFTWSSDPYGGAWTWAGISAYVFGVDQSFVGLASPTMMTQFYLDVLYNIPGSQPYDINGDGVVNYLDVSSLVSHYGESY